MTNEDLMNLFQSYGSVNSANILKDKMSGRSKGFGFVDMPNDDEANAAISGLNNTEVQGRKVVVNESQPKEKSAGGGGFRKKSFGGGGGYNKGGGGYNKGGYNKDY